MSSSLKLFFLSSFILFNTSFASAVTRDECRVKWNRISSQFNLSNLPESIKYKCGSELKYSIKNYIDNNKYNSYKKARQIMFSTLDNQSGTVCSVYSDRCLDTSGIPDHRVMNCEHSWPQSKGAVGIAKSDLHHLFPVMSRMNSRRGNYPFCEVSNVSYEGYGSLLGRSKNGTRCFEPRDDHKGDLARAMFYFSIRYGKKIDSEQEFYFRKWILEDKVSEKEIFRNDQIESYQNNRNPFIDFEYLVELITDF